MVPVVTVKVFEGSIQGIQGAPSGKSHLLENGRGRRLADQESGGVLVPMCCRANALDALQEELGHAPEQCGIALGQVHMQRSATSALERLEIT